MSTGGSRSRGYILKLEMDGLTLSEARVHLVRQFEAQESRAGRDTAQDDSRGLRIALHRPLPVRPFEFAFRAGVTAQP